MQIWPGMIARIPVFVHTEETEKKLNYIVTSRLAWNKVRLCLKNKQKCRFDFGGNILKVKYSALIPTTITS